MIIILIIYVGSNYVSEDSESADVIEEEDHVEDIVTVIITVH